MLVINFASGPGKGKSTTAAGLFYKMKVHGHNVELINEYAKDMTWEKRDNILEDQLYILAKQNRKLERLRGKVDYVITDSPLFLGLAYTKKDYHETFKPFVMDVWRSYNNVTFFLTNDGTLTYQESGRNQNEEQSNELDGIILNLMRENRVHYNPIMIKSGDEDMKSNHIGEIYQAIMGRS